MRRVCKLLAWVAVAVSGVPATAHDIPNARVDRAIQVTVNPRRLVIDYEVSLSELSLLQDLRRLVERVESAEQSALLRQYSEVTGPLNAKGILSTLDGRDLPLAYEGSRIIPDTHPRIVYRLEAPLPESGRVRIQDTNFASSEGTSRLAARAVAPIAFKGYDGPTLVESVDARPIWMLSDEDERATTQVSIDFLSEPGSKATPTPPPEAVLKTRRTVQEPTNSRLADLLKGHDAATWGFLWLVAFGLGAAHSLQPGHGKTVVAAASLGSGFGPAGGALLALATTAAHFTSVLLIAALLWQTPTSAYAGIQGVATFTAGTIIGVIGFWRIGHHVSGRLGPAPATEAPTSARSLVALGVASGIVPCWDAVLLVVVSALAGVLAQGLLLLSGFSLGMASVLVAVGLLSGRIRTVLGPERVVSTWTRWVSIASGAVLAVFGVLLVYRGG